MQGRADDAECNFKQTQNRLLIDVHPERDRQVQDYGNDREQPDEFRAAIDALDQKIPGRMATGGGENESKGERGHWDYLKDMRYWLCETAPAYPP